jgi:hypothetical protein
MNDQQLRDHLLNWIKLTKRCKEDEQFKEYIVELCKRDILFFFKTFLYTYDPRTEKKILPFVLYPFQQEFILDLERCFKEKKSMLVEKSRDMGFSWMVLGWFTYHFIFTKGFSAGIASRKSHLVDDLGNMGSLLQRMRFMLNRLPPFLLNGWNEAKHSKSMALFHPVMESSITGESGDEIGRGDRKSVYVLDEFAFIPRSSVVHAAVSQTSDMLIFGSTPNGKGNEFARLRWKTKIHVQTLHWKKHPKKNQAWYEKQKLTLDEATIAQEIDISYEKSTVGRVYKAFDVNKHARENQAYNTNYPVFLTFDWGIGDPTACCFLQDYAGTIKIFDHFEVKDCNIEQIFNLVFTRLDKHKINRSLVGGWYGDPDARNRNIVSGQSISSFIKDKYGIKLRYKLPNEIRPRILSTRSLLMQNRILVDKDLLLLIECFENYKYPDKESGENETPLHNWASHSMSAIEYYCVYEHGMDQFKKYSEIKSMAWR